MNRMVSVGGVLVVWALFVTQPATDTAVTALRQRAAAALAQTTGVVDVPGLDRRGRAERARRSQPRRGLG